MLRRLRLISLLSFALGAWACEAPIDLEFDLAESSPQLVVVSNFAPDMAVHVYVSSLQPISPEGQTSTHLLDAQVEIYQGELFIEALELVEPKAVNGIPFYTTNILQPQVNVEYTIRVSAPGFEPVTAMSRIPRPILLRSARLSDYVAEELVEEGKWVVSFRLQLSFEDPSEERNFYHLSLFQQVVSIQAGEAGDTLRTGTRLKAIHFNPQDNTKHRVAHIGGGLLLSDEGFEQALVEYDIPLRIELQKGEEMLGQLFIELRTVSEEYYRYFAALSRQRQSFQSPFAEPVILFDNIDGGQGVFAGYNTVRDSLDLGL
jgi:hypothetical protein